MNASQLLRLEHKILGSVTVESFASDCKVCIVIGTDENGNERLRPALKRRKKQTLAELKRELLGQKRENLQAYKQQVESEQELVGVHVHEGYAERNMESFARMIGLEIDE
jgi:hypothetical protein